MQGRVFVEIERCIACKRCVLACALEHSASKDVVAAMTEVPAPRPRVRLVEVDDVAVPTECRHCDAAACVAACPTGAMYKSAPEGPVLLALSRCVGCGSCVVACPYGVVRQHLETHQVYKCDLCEERLAAERIPACVEACPTGCLSFRTTGQVKSWLKSVKQNTAEPAATPGEAAG